MAVEAHPAYPKQGAIVNLQTARVTVALLASARAIRTFRLGMAPAHSARRRNRESLSDEASPDQPVCREEAQSFFVFPSIFFSILFFARTAGEFRVLDFGKKRQFPSYEISKSRLLESSGNCRKGAVEDVASTRIDSNQPSRARARISRSSLVGSKRSPECELSLRDDGGGSDASQPREAKLVEHGGFYCSRLGKSIGRQAINL